MRAGGEPSTKARRAAFNKRTERKRSLRNELVARYGRACWLCNRPIAHGDTLSIDHVRPLSKGGSSKIKNLRLAHERCNRKRGDGPVPELLLTADMALQTRAEAA
jgi:5-methylcytosine-specific restriction endonuclease McrA